MLGLNSKTVSAQTWEELDKKINEFTKGKFIIRIHHKGNQPGVIAHILYKTPCIERTGL